MAPYLQNALDLLIFAVVLPVIGGVVARTCFFSRDQDDVALHKGHVAAAEQAVSHEPEPEPLFSEAWPEAPKSAVVSLEPVATTPAVLAPAKRTYRGTGLDVAQVGNLVEALWRAFTQRSNERPEWEKYGQWSGSSPFALAGAQGAAPGSTTLTVEAKPAQGAEARELMEIWESEILPELRRRLGTAPFRSPDR